MGADPHSYLGYARRPLLMDVFQLLFCHLHYLRGCENILGDLNRDSPFIARYSVNPKRTGAYVTSFTLHCGTTVGVDARHFSLTGLLAPPLFHLSLIIRYGTSIFCKVT